MLPVKSHIPVKASQVKLFPFFPAWLWRCRPGSHSGAVQLILSFHFSELFSH